MVSSEEPISDMLNADCILIVYYCCRCCIPSYPASSREQCEYKPRGIEVLSYEFRSLSCRSQLHDISRTVLYVALCLNSTVQHVGVHKTGIFSNLLILLFYDRKIN